MKLPKCEQNSHMVYKFSAWYLRIILDIYDDWLYTFTGSAMMITEGGQICNHLLLRICVRLTYV